MKKTPFNNVITKGVAGAIVGIFAGLLLGVLIWSLQEIVIYLKNTLLHISDYGGPGNMPLDMFTILGMCFGALIGSMHGGAIAVSEEKKKSK